MEETQKRPKTLADLKEPGDELEPEARAIFEWRRDEIREMGYGPDEAVEIAYSNIDMAQLRGLVAAGATLDQARRILTGTDFLGDEADATRLLSPSDKKKRERRGVAAV